MAAAPSIINNLDTQGKKLLKADKEGKKSILQGSHIQGYRAEYT